MTHTVEFLLSLGVFLLLDFIIIIGVALRAKTFAGDISDAEFARLRAEYEKSQRAHNGQADAWRKLSAARNIRLRQEIVRRDAKAARDMLRFGEMK